MPHRKLILSSLLLALGLCSGCHRHSSDQLRVGVSPGPAEEILDAVQPALAKDGIELQVVPFTDYIQPNLALAGHDLDANLYQNVTFLNQFNHDHATNFVALTKVYIPLMAIYPGKTKSLDALKQGAHVSLPNDPVNQARALNLLQSAGLLTLRAGIGDHATLTDVASNPHHLDLVEVDASQLPRSRDDVDLALINANFALDAGLSPIKDALVHEGLDSLYANVLATNAAQQTDPRIVKLAAVLRSDTARSFITVHYKGAIYPAP
jgi:D-methionine transport system substrate-binding protein